jgi:tRNA (cmo5U34)-methyltransferase
MLERASQRVGGATAGQVITIQGDVRGIEFPEAGVDIILAAAVLHHLREESQWRNVFAPLHRALRPGRSFWAFDLVESSIPSSNGLMRKRYGEYLVQLRDEAYRDHVLNEAAARSSHSEAREQ